MRKNKEFPYLIFAILCVWFPLFMGAFDKDKPSSSTSLRNSNPEILANWSALETSFGAHHEFSTGGTNSGDNLRIKFNAPISTPTNAANISWLYEKDVSSVVELHWLDESGNELQMTSGGDLYSSAGLTVTNASTFNGSITLGAGDDLIGSATSDITFNTDKFTVAGATGNTVIAGTLDVTGNIDPTSYETTNGGFLDEDDMSSDSATKVASQQSIKAFVNTNRTGWTPTIAAGYAGEESITFPNGMIFKQGSDTCGSVTSKAVTFSVAFPNAATTVWNQDFQSGNLATSGPMPCHSLSTTGFTVRNGNAGSRVFKWFAIGY